MEGTLHEVAGKDGRVIKRLGRGEEEGNEEREIGREEVRRAIKKLKEGKARRIDGIPGEVWKYEGEDIERWVWKFSNRIWRGEGRLEEQFGGRESS